MNNVHTINLGGLVITLDEPAYLNLKQYIESLRKYFSTNQDGDDIIRDIEYRIAEKLRKILAQAHKEVVELDDVKLIRDEIGSPSDFEEVQQEDSTTKNTTREIQRLYRLTNGKMIAGVANGLADFLSIDVSIIRVAFALAMVFGGYGLMVYIVLWIVLPAKSENLTDQKIRHGKLYRNPEDEIVAGVASGIATCLNFDVRIVRLLFVLSVFWGGLGIFLYFLFWMAIPYAKTPSELNDMKGQHLRYDEYAKTEKDTYLNANGLGIIGQLAENVIRFLVKIEKIGFTLFSFFFGILFILIGFLFTVSILILSLVFLNISELNINSPIPISTFTTGNPNIDIISLVGGLLFVLIPVLFIITAGIKLLFKKSVFRGTWVRPVVLIWFGSLAILCISATKIATEFTNETSLTALSMQTSTTLSDTLAIEINNENNSNDLVDVTFLQGNTDSITIIDKISAYGNTKQNAIKNASMVSHQVSMNGNKIYINNHLIFKNNSIFRGQNADVTIYVPEGKVIALNTKAVYKIENWIDDFDRDESEPHYLIMKKGKLEFQKQ